MKWFQDEAKHSTTEASKYSELYHYTIKKLQNVTFCGIVTIILLT